MKSKVFIPVILFSMLSLAALSQTEIKSNLPDDHFYHDQNTNKVFWQCVFPTSQTIDEVYNHFIQQNKIENYEVINDILSGINKPVKNNFKLLHKTVMSAPFLISCYDVKSTVNIEYKENRYRVTLTDITMINNGSNRQITEPTVLIEEYALNKKGFVKSFNKSCSEIIDTSLVLFFTINELPESEW
jgi:hypothetical protein